MCSYQCWSPIYLCNQGVRHHRSWGGGSCTPPFSNVSVFTVLNPPPHLPMHWPPPSNSWRRPCLCSNVTRSSLKMPMTGRRVTHFKFVVCFSLYYYSSLLFFQIQWISFIRILSTNMLKVGYVELNRNAPEIFVSRRGSFLGLWNWGEGGV